MDFIGTFLVEERWMKVRCIIATIEFLTTWWKAKLVKDCSSSIAGNFIEQNYITRFGWQWSSSSDQEKHFVNQTIKVLLINTIRVHSVTNMQMIWLRISIKYEQLDRQRLVYRPMLQEMPPQLVYLYSKCRNGCKTLSIAPYDVSKAFR